MRAIRLDEDVHPPSEFRAPLAALARRVTETGRPLRLTQNGCGVILTPGRAILAKVHGLAPHSYLVELEAWAEASSLEPDGAGS